MRDIYSVACTVLAWTGERSIDSDEAIDFIEHLATCTSNWHPSSLLTSEHLQEIGIDAATINWQTPFNFLRRPFWRRVWIVQELVNAGDLHKYVNDESCMIGCGFLWISKALWTRACLLLMKVVKSSAGFIRAGKVLEPLRSLIG